MESRTDSEGEPGPRAAADDTYRAIFDALPEGCILVGDDGIILDLNAEAERVFGYTRQEIIGQDIDILVPRRFRDRHRSERSEYSRHPSVRPMGIGMELRARHKDGSELPVEIGLSPVHTPTGHFVIAAIHDVTDRIRLRAFGSGLLRGAEEERRRLARELHDDTAQSLSALLLRLQMARRTEDEERRASMLAEMHAEILRASESVRHILRGLRPPALEEAGVVAAIRAHIRSTLAETGLSVELDAAPVEDRLSADVKLALYRIVQEAISNVVRHAAASRIQISVATGDGKLQATVTDDGCGFDLGRAVSSGGRGLGVLGMQERAIILGGRVEIGSAPDTGTRVSIELPLDHDAGGI
jgi:PAS domain S-box-containing protein